MTSGYPYRMSKHIGLMIVLVGLSACADGQVSTAGASQSQALEPGEPGPAMSYTRMLRRMLVSLEGRIPTVEEVEALQALPDDAAKQAALMAQVDASLQSVAFYQQMVMYGHDLLRTSQYIAGNTDHPTWKGDLTASLYPCPAGTMHAGKYGQLSEDYSPAFGDRPSVLCNDVNARVATVNPWWAPDTTVDLIGRAADPRSSINGANCGHIALSLYGHSTSQDDFGCGCGPAAHFCMIGDEAGFHQDWTNRDSRHRSAWDQPARYFAHLAWHDRDISDLVLGDTAVGDLNMRHMDFRFGREQSDSSAIDADPDWWRPSTWTTPASPDVPADSPLSWHEYRVEDLDPTRVSADVRFDPRTQDGLAPAMPAAGVLTMMATMSSFPRERVRGARALETFACRDFSPPPPEAHFPEYVQDPATGGPCMACHVSIDPASIHFKRWGFLGYSSAPIMGGLSRHGRFADHPPYDEAYKRWGQVFVAETKLTPVSSARIEANPEARFIDFLPTDQTLFGLTSDGTIGPRGFGKLVVESGEFDSCMAQRLYERFAGNRLDRGRDANRLRELTTTFASGGREVRAYVRSLMQREDCFANPAANGCEFFRGL
jgi:hypothetical protein